jgi:hypothetical protein
MTPLTMEVYPLWFEPCLCRSRETNRDRHDDQIDQVYHGSRTHQTRCLSCREQAAVHPGCCEHALEGRNSLLMGLVVMCEQLGHRGADNQISTNRTGCFTTRSLNRSTWPIISPEC